MFTAKLKITKKGNSFCAKILTANKIQCNKIVIYNDVTKQAFLACVFEKRLCEDVKKVS